MNSAFTPAAFGEMKTPYFRPRGVPHKKKHRAKIQTWKYKEMEKVIKKKFDKVFANHNDDGERLISPINRFLEIATKEAVLIDTEPD